MPKSQINTAPGAGPPLETFELGTGTHVPTVLLRGFDDAGDPKDIQVDSAGRVNISRKAGIWYDDSSTPLTANDDIVSTSRDCTLSGEATDIANGLLKEARAVAISDVSGTLTLEVSRDAVNWRKLAETDTGEATTGGLHVAEILYVPVTRYLRFSYVNGPTNQTHFLLQSMLVY